MNNTTNKQNPKHEQPLPELQTTEEEKPKNENSERLNIQPSSFNQRIGMTTADWD